MSITPEQIARLRALCAKATPGPWELGENFHGDAWVVKSPHQTFPVCASILAHTHDLEFIAAARTYLPLLLDALEQRAEG